MSSGCTPGRQWPEDGATLTGTAVSEISSFKVDEQTKLNRRTSFRQVLKTGKSENTDGRHGVFENETPSVWVSV